MITFGARARIRRRLPQLSKPSSQVLAAIGRVASRVHLARALAPGDAERGRAIVTAAACGVAGLASFDGPRALTAVPLGLAGGVYLSRALQRREAEREIAEVRGALPDVIERLRTCVLAGMSIERALRTVAARTGGRLGRSFENGLAALDVGSPRSRAYEIIAAHAGADELRTVLAALARAERFGTSVATTLTAQAAELRARARAEAEAEMRAAPVKMIFPLVLCFLPAFVLLTVAPIAVSAVRTLSGI